MLTADLPLTIACNTTGLIVDGLFASHGVRLLTIDRPSAGGSSPVPIRHRLAASHAALLAILAHHHISQIHILAHSNGLLYSMYSILRLLPPPDATPPPVRVLSWSLTSPWVPPWHSGSRALNAARWVPAYATGSLGTLISTLQAVTGTVNDWRPALPTALAGWWAAPNLATSAPSASGSGSGSSSPVLDKATPPEPARELTPREDLDAWLERNAHRAPAYRGFGRGFFPARASEVVTEWVAAEGLGAWGDEALVSLRKGAGAAWGWGADSETGVEEEDLLYERGFGAVKAGLEARGEGMRVTVAFGEGDALIPPLGRAFLRQLLVDKLGMVGARDWVEVEGAGHDDLLAREVAILPVAERARRPVP